ncbi:hypothetical protein KUF71_002691 [Frankliniella fusca]|uniref:Uncharacterized protein n=1 Tax=Frankliniella fusca TaxID=407009 RepID=A0AAE1LV03_9NEOP|nr:hypothetical protein KUF71_002691 [Frankliniella fusca]
MALMHSSSSEALPTELDLWITYLTQLAQEKSTVQVFNPLANFDSSNTIELEVPGVGYSYLDLPHMMLYTKQKIVNADGSDITAADNSDATLVDVSINGTVISQSTLTYPYRAFIETKLNYDKAAKDTHLQQRMWYEDSPGHLDSVTISPSVLLAHAQALEKSPAKYPVNRIDIKTVTITQGLRDKTIDNLFLNSLPQRVIIGFVDNRAFNGDYTRNPFNFQHFNLNYIQMHVDGDPVPAQPLTPDFSNDLYMECYNTLFSGTGIHWKDEGNNISWSAYPKGSTLFAFDLSPDWSANQPHWNLQRQGTLRLDLRFAAPLAQPINCIIYAEFQNLIEIDKNRNVIVDFSI